MSASLVGSEMCIRDRAHRRHPAGPVGLAAVAAAVATGRPTAGERRPVSYTHLTLPTIRSV
eukprot:3424238-Alexandrium_andersonii.AAC.1